MPANLPPQYYAAEEVFRKARTPEEKIAAIEDMIAIMPRHKGTDRVWGSDKRDGIQVRRDHVLQDKDIVEFHV